MRLLHAILPVKSAQKYQTGPASECGTGSATLATTDQHRRTDAAQRRDILDAADQALEPGDRACRPIEGFAADYGIAFRRRLPPARPHNGLDAFSLLAMMTARLERRLRDAGFRDALVYAAWIGGRQQIAIHPNGEAGHPRRYCSAEREAEAYIQAYLASDEGRIDAQRARLHQLISCATPRQLAGIAGWLADIGDLTGRERGQSRLRRTGPDLACKRETRKRAPPLRSRSSSCRAPAAAWKHCPA